MLLGLSLFIRLLIAAAAFAIPPGLLGALFFGLKGGAYGAGVGVLAFGLCFFLIEDGIVRALGATARTSVALQHSLERALEKSGGRAADFPRVLFFHDAGPSALFIRTPGGVGTVLLSQGLLATLDEGELRAVFGEACARAREPGVVLRSLCFWAALGLARAGSPEWASAVFLGNSALVAGLEPRSALRFAAIFPGIRFFVRLASRPGSATSSAATRRSAKGSYEREFGEALRKMELSRKLHGSTHNFAAGFAGLVNLSLDR